MQAAAPVRSPAPSEHLDWRQRREWQALHDLQRVGQPVWPQVNDSLGADSSTIIHPSCRLFRKRPPDRFVRHVDRRSINAVCRPRNGCLPGSTVPAKPGLKSRVKYGPLKYSSMRSTQASWCTLLCDMFMATSVIARLSLSAIPCLGQPLLSTRCSCPTALPSFCTYLCRREPVEGLSSLVKPRCGSGLHHL